MDPETLASEFSRLQSEQERLRDDARFLMEQADRLAEATEGLALVALAGGQSPPPRRPPGRRAGHRREHHVHLRLIQGGIAAAAAALIGWRVYLRTHVLAATAAGVTAVAVTGAAGVLTAVMIMPANPGQVPRGGSHSVTVQPAAGTPLTPRAHRRRRQGLRVTTRPATPRRPGRSPLPRPPRTASPSPSPLVSVTVPTLLPTPSPTPSPSGKPLCILGICL